MRAFFRTLTGRSRHRQSFEQVFASFREVLDRNNRSLEIITDMGETLGGDYLFDIQYVRRSYAELYAAMGSSLESFTRLTQDRYPSSRGPLRTSTSGSGMASTRPAGIKGPCPVL